MENGGDAFFTAPCTFSGVYFDGGTYLGGGTYSGGTEYTFSEPAICGVDAVQDSDTIEFNDIIVEAVTSTPEPSSLLLLGTGLVDLLALRRLGWS